MFGLDAGQWTLLFTIAIFITPIIVGLGRRANSYRNRPIAYLHYWWVDVIDTDGLWKSPLVNVGISLPRSGARSDLDRRLNRIVKGDLPQESELVNWLRYPTNRIGVSSSSIQRISVLRVVVVNGSRREALHRDEFGTVRLTVELGPSRVHGWRKGLFGPQLGSGDQFDAADDSHGPTFIDIRLPKSLEPLAEESKNTIRDEISISELAGVDRRPIGPARTTSDIRIWIKPWRPSVKPHFWTLPSRCIRWISSAYRPKRFLPN